MDTISAGLLPIPAIAIALLAVQLERLDALHVLLDTRRSIITVWLARLRTARRALLPLTHAQFARMGGIVSRRLLAVQLHTAVKPVPLSLPIVTHAPMLQRVQLATVDSGKYRGRIVELPCVPLIAMYAPVLARVLLARRVISLAEVLAQQPSVEPTVQHAQVQSIALPATPGIIGYAKRQSRTVKRWPPPPVAPPALQEVLASALLPTPRASAAALQQLDIPDQ